MTDKCKLEFAKGKTWEIAITVSRFIELLQFGHVKFLLSYRNDMKSITIYIYKNILHTNSIVQKKKKFKWLNVKSNAFVYFCFHRQKNVKNLYKIIIYLLLRADC